MAGGRLGNQSDWVTVFKQDNEPYKRESVTGIFCRYRNNGRIASWFVKFLLTERRSKMAGIPFDRFKQWNGWMDTIYAEVHGLVISRHVYSSVQQMIGSNPAIQQSSSFYECYGIEHAAYAAISIRRSMDTDPQTITLARLLGSISAYPTVLSRKRYVDHFTSSGYSASLGEQQFDELVGPGMANIDPKQVATELATLTQLGASCKLYADKCIAHRDKNPPANLPTFPDIDNCISYMEELVKRYLVLLRYTNQDSLLPTWLYDWKDIFRKPWIP